LPQDSTPPPIALGYQSPPPHAPGRGLALGLLLAINLMNYVDRQVLAAVEELIHKSFPNTTQAQMGSLAFAFLISYMILSPMFGLLADRFSRWLLVGIGVILWSLASGATGLAASFAILLATRCLVGVGEAAYGPVAPTIIADLYPVEKRGSVLAWFYIAIPVGSAIGYMLGGYIGSLPAMGWRGAFYVVVPPGILLGILALFMKDPRRGTAGARIGGAGKVAMRWAEYAALVRNRSFVLDTLGMTAMTFAIGGIAFWIPTYISVYRGGGSLPHVNFIFGLLTVITGIVATLLGGWVGDRLRPRYSGSYFLVSGVGLLAGFPLVLAMLVVPFPMAWICVFFAEFCLFFNTGPSNTILANATPASIRATAFAVNIFVIHLLGDAISPWLIGWIADRSTMSIAFAFMSLMMLAGGVFWLMGAKYLAVDEAAAAGTAIAPVV
jgi:MFS transporter, Spinster family, sphingosine-1-phosphate transporter